MLKYRCLIRLVALNLPPVWLKDVFSQGRRVATLPPNWAIQYGNALVALAQTLWPARPDVEQMRKQWQR
ncbi:VasL domain-containing protein [Lelliottia sp. RWM.1]|uniref:VasL domain-containing protein n=1 Tax=Lelliottia sp. RWM.1 TaxID=2663242 RepID=UPI0035C839B0|nr:hypothetical protein [Lelliottia sp. RWM.1]